VGSAFDGADIAAVDAVVVAVTGPGDATLVEQRAQRGLLSGYGRVTPDPARVSWLVPLHADKWWRLDRHTRLSVACLTAGTTPRAYVHHVGVGLDEPSAVVRSDHHCLALRTFRHDGGSTTGALEDEEGLHSHALRLPAP
jgi:hypothetical protein